MAREPVIVALETSTEACSVAVGCASSVRSACTVEAPRQHTVQLLPMLERAMAEAGVSPGMVDGVAFGCGPGAFAGVRLGAGVAQGLCLAWGVPAMPVSTLAALAQGAGRRHGALRVLAALDARMAQVYWGVYELDAAGRIAPCAPESVDDPGAVAVEGDDWFGVGRGFARYSQELPATARGQDPEALPEARDLLPQALERWQAGATLAATAIRPVYLREGV